MAIIAILAALLLPVLSKARNAADSAVCRNNLHQIGIALQTYAADTGGYPVSAWLINLQPYIKTEWPSYNRTPSGQLLPRSGVYACPGYNRIPGWYSGSPGDPAGTVSQAYGYNYLGIGFTAANEFQPSDSCLGLGGVNLTVRTDPNHEIRRPTKESEVIKPVDMIAVGDSVLGGWQSFPDLGEPWLDDGLSNQDFNRPDSHLWIRGRGHVI